MTWSVFRGLPMYPARCTFSVILVVVAFVYLLLAAQYESFLIPFAVILSLPVGLFGAFLLVNMLGLANDIYAQIGIVMLVGLLGKNAVLIVEVAKQQEEAGRGTARRRRSKRAACDSGRSTRMC